MRKFGIVFRFELRNLLFKKSLILATTVISLFVLGLTFVPRFLSSDSDDTQTGDPIIVEPTIDYAYDSSYGIFYGDDSVREFVAPFGGEAKVFQSEEALKKAVEDQSISTGVVFDSLTGYHQYQYDTSMTSLDSDLTHQLLQHINFERALHNKGIAPEDVYAAQAIDISSETITLGKDRSQGVGFVYIFIIATYMLIILYGSSVSNSVAREKDNRTMELLITSTDPRTLIIGKVFAAGLVGLIQFGTIILAAVVGIYLNLAFIPSGLLAMIGGNLSVDVIVVFVLFTILGYLLYLFIYAAMGSLVSKMEDVNSAVQPITMLFIIAYFIAMTAFTNPEMGYVKISSYIPFVSLFTMPIRYMLSTVSIFELLISLSLIVVTTILIAMMSVYIYRFGSLNYGNRLKLKDVFKAWKRGE